MHRTAGTQTSRSKTQARHIAKAMLSALDHQVKALRSRITAVLADTPADERGRLQTMLNCIDKRDAQALEAFGLDARYAWMNDIVAAIIRGEWPVRIHLPAIEIVSSTFDSAQLTPSNRLSIQLVAFLREVCAASQRMTIEIPINDALKKPSAKQRSHYTQAVVDFLKAEHALTTEDKPDKEYIVTCASQAADRLPELLDRLRVSKAGRLMPNADGDLHFHPTRRLVEMLALRNPASRKELLVAGILIQRADGSLPPQTLDAIAFLDVTAASGLHLGVMDRQLVAEQDKAYALIRALDVIRQENYHNIFFDSASLPPEILLLWLCQLLTRYTQDFLERLNRYDDWQQFDPYEYAMRNYGERILPEDDQIINGVIKAFEQLGIADGSLERVADVGTGPNLYSPMLVAPFVAPNANIDILEFSPPNRAYLQKTLEDAIEAEHADMWAKFEQLMVRYGGSRYAHALATAKQKANVQFGDVFTLPRHAYDLISSYFVTESVVDSHLPFRKALKSLAQAIKPNTGILVMAHMLESEGYYAGIGTNFPAVRLTVEQLADAYRDTGLDFVIVPVSDNDTGHRVRDGYHGMAFVVAVSHQSDRKTQAALDAVAQLPGSRRSIASYDYSIEYCHIYTNEHVGPEHTGSIAKLNAIVEELDEKLATYNLCVMIDDYTTPTENFDYAKLLEWMDSEGARPHFWINESALIPDAAAEVIELITDKTRKRSLQKYIEKKKYPCSLLIATWYLARLGKLKTAPAEITSTAERLINILPARFMSYEEEAQDILAATPYAELLSRITNEYLDD